MNPALERMMLQLVSERTGRPVEELRAATRGGPAALAASLGIDLPPEVESIATDAVEVAPEPVRATSPERQHGQIDRRIERMEARMGELEEAHAAALDLLDHVAATMGACNHCFGYDPTCTACLGRGAPGRRNSADPLTLQRWLAAMTRRLSAHSTPPAQATE